MEVQEIRDKLEYFNDPDFKFLPEPHIYTYKGNEFISATTFVKQYEVPFDSQMRSLGCSRSKTGAYVGMSQQEILDQWAKKSEDGRRLGTLVHAAIEDILNGNPGMPGVDVKVGERVKWFEKFRSGPFKDFKKIAAEPRLFSIEYRIAGSADFLALFEGKVYMFDWKTNREFKKHSDYLFPPFDFEKHWDINTHSIQQSIYRLMLEFVGIPVEECFLGWVKQSEPVEILACRDYRKLVMQCLEERKKGFDGAA